MLPFNKDNAIIFVLMGLCIQSKLIAMLFTLFAIKTNLIALSYYLHADF